MPTLEELITARCNAYEKINSIREKYNDIDMPDDVMAELTAAANEMSRLKPLIDNREKTKQIFIQFGPGTLNRLNPDTNFAESLQIQRDPNNWVSPRAAAMKTLGVNIPPRNVTHRRNRKTIENFFSPEAIQGFETLLTSNFNRAMNAADANVDAYFKALDRFNSTFKISDPERAGTFTVPEEFWNGILKNLDDMTHVQSMARVMSITAQTLAIRMRLAKASMIGPGEELSDAQTNIENTLRYGKRTITPQFHTGAFRISNALLKDSSINILDYIQSEISIDVAEYMETLFLTGNGVGNNPVGLLHLATAGEGIDSSRDVNLGDNVFTAETLVDVRYALKETYARNAVWMLHRLMLAEIAKLKGSDGHPLWRASMVPNVPDTILGRPMVLNEFMPYSTANDAYGILFGDFSNYWVVFKDLMTMQVQSELYSNTNETGYIYRMRFDAQPMLAEAFVRGKFV